MKRRDLFKSGMIAGAGSLLLPGNLSANESKSSDFAKKAKNIIFLVSDGMSSGTLNMADLFMQRKLGRTSNWLQLYRDKKITRALMDTASASSLVTDSAAASSSWGGGIRVPNGSLNVSAKGEAHTPILQKFKKAGKSVGCVTTVPITHATPAGFCVSIKGRDDQAAIADLYLDLRFDVMMGGGKKYFSPEKRKDKADKLAEFKSKGYQVILSRTELFNLNGSAPLLGVFADDALPYTVDRESSESDKIQVPTLAEMTDVAIRRMKDNSSGFVLQVEAGKVDWAAHGNDISALINDQIAFDDAVSVAIKFAESRNDTLVVVTTDHGNSNPGLIYGDLANEHFDNIQHFKQSNLWLLNNIGIDKSPEYIRQLVGNIHGIKITKEDAAALLDGYIHLEPGNLYDPRQLPFKKLAQIQTKYTSVGWIADDHSADFVELCMFGAGSQDLAPFVLNTDLHHYMLKVTGLK